jgi:hypothetical protein
MNGDMTRGLLLGIAIGTAHRSLPRYALRTPLREGHSNNCQRKDIGRSP